MFSSTCLSVPMACSSNTPICCFMSVSLQTNGDLCFYKWLTLNNQISFLAVNPHYFYALWRSQGYLCLIGFRWIRLQSIPAQPKSNTYTQARIKRSCSQDGFGGVSATMWYSILEKKASLLRLAVSSHWSMEQCCIMHLVAWITMKLLR